MARKKTDPTPIDAPEEKTLQVLSLACILLTKRQNEYLDAELRDKKTYSTANPSTFVLRGELIAVEPLADGIAELLRYYHWEFLSPISAEICDDRGCTKEHF